MKFRRGIDPVTAAIIAGVGYTVVAIGSWMIGKYMARHMERPNYEQF